MAEGGGLLNRCTTLKLYPGFESLPHRQPSRQSRLRAAHAVDLLHDQEDRERHDQEVQHHRDERPIGQHRAVLLGFFQHFVGLAGERNEPLGEVEPARHQPKQRHDDVVHH